MTRQDARTTFPAATDSYLLTALLVVGARIPCLGVVGASQEEGRGAGHSCHLGPLWDCGRGGGGWLAGWGPRARLLS